MIKIIVKDTQDVVKVGVATTGGGVTKHSELTLDDGTNPHGTTSADVGLGDVDNTSDADKPISTATQSALDKKLDINSLTSNLILYPTTSAADVSGYYKMVSDITSPDYDDTAVDVATPSITTSDVYISSLISDAGVFVGNTGVINISIIGNIKRTVGSGGAEFYFEVYKRDISDVETLLTTSLATSKVDVSSYEQFAATALLTNTELIATDRLVYKFYGTKVGTSSSPTFAFQFGGVMPVRSSVPVPNIVQECDCSVDIRTGNTLLFTKNTIYNNVTPSSASTLTLDFTDAVAGTVVQFISDGTEIETITSTKDIIKQGNQLVGQIGAFFFLYDGVRVWQTHLPVNNEETPFEFGNAIKFDGVNDKVTFPQITSVNNFVASFWIKPTTLNKVVLGNSTDNSYVIFQSATQIQISLKATGTRTFVFPTASLLNTRVHIVIARISNVWYCWRNGIAHSSVSGAGNGDIVLDTIANWAGNSSLYNALLTELCIKNDFTITNQNVIDLYNAGEGKEATEIITNPEIYLKTNSSTGLTALNDGSLADGTLVNFVNDDSQWQLF